MVCGFANRAVIHQCRQYSIPAKEKSRELRELRANSRLEKHKGYYEEQRDQDQPRIQHVAAE